MEDHKTTDQFILDFALMREVMPRLEECFGVGWGYLNDILDDFLPKDGLTNTTYQEITETDYKIYTDYPVDIGQFDRLFVGVEKYYQQVDHLKYSLLLLGFIFNRYINNEEYNQYCSELIQEPFVYENYIKKDLLNLYILINSPTTPDTKITIKHATGSVKLDNYNNFFLKKILKSYVDKHLPDVTTLEQAQNELQDYKGSAGRSPEDLNFNVISYGIYKLFGAHKRHSKVAGSPKELQDLIKGYLQLLNAWIFEKDIGANLSYFKKREGKSGYAPKYDYRGLPQLCSLSELSAPRTYSY